MKNTIYIWIGLGVLILLWWISRQQQSGTGTNAGISGVGASGGISSMSTGAVQLASGTYIVQLNDSWDNIASRYNMTTTTLVTKNGFNINIAYPSMKATGSPTPSNPNLLYIGQVIKV